MIDVAAFFRCRNMLNVLCASDYPLDDLIDMRYRDPAMESLLQKYARDIKAYCLSQEGQREVPTPRNSPIPHAYCIAAFFHQSNVYEKLLEAGCEATHDELLV